MIGCIGIGGVILVPALVFLADVPIQISIPAAMLAYILSGLVATAVFAHNKSIRWSMAAWLCLGATPTAIANMQAVTERYGFAPQAFIIVPVVGAFLIDVANAIVISGFAGIIPALR